MTERGLGWVDINAMLARKAGFSALPVLTAKTEAVRRFSKNRLFGSAWRESQFTLDEMPLSRPQSPPISTQSAAI